MRCRGLPADDARQRRSWASPAQDRRRAGGCTRGRHRRLRRLFVDDDGVERDRLRRALAQLPVRQRTVLVLRFFEDRSEGDIAALLGTSVGTVKSQVSRGLDRLRAVLGEQEADE